MKVVTSSAPVALITGASSGIGMALAHQFAADGYHVVLAARSVPKLSALADELGRQYGVPTSVVGIDLEALEGPAALHTAIRSLGLTVSALVNNAGYGSFGEFKDTDLAGDLAMMQLNMGAVVSLTKLFMTDLLATKGKLLNVASTAAFQPGPYMAVYYATKSFVLSFTEAVAAELEGTDVTVTALCPGPTASGFQDKAAMLDSALVKGKRLPTAEDVARSGYRALQSKRRVHVPGLMNCLMAQSVRVTPRRLVTSMVKAMSRPV